MSRRKMMLSLSVSLPQWNPTQGDWSASQKLATNLSLKSVCSEMANSPPEFMEREAARLGNEIEAELRQHSQDPDFWKKFAMTLLQQVKGYDESKR